MLDDYCQAEVKMGAETFLLDTTGVAADKCYNNCTYIKEDKHYCLTELDDDDIAVRCGICPSCNLCIGGFLCLYCSVGNP